MRDRFKFRVWDKEQKQMHYDDFIVTSVGMMHKPKVASLEMREIKEKKGELAYRYLFLTKQKVKEILEG